MFFFFVYIICVFATYTQENIVHVKSRGGPPLRENARVASTSVAPVHGIMVIDSQQYSNSLSIAI